VAVLWPLGVSAADLPAPVPPMPVAAPFTWTGCYVGILPGYHISDDDDVEIGGDPDLEESQDAGNVPFELPTSSDGPTIGGQAGCNFQHSRLVFGPELDLSVGDLSDEEAVTLGGVNVTTTFKRDIELFGTVRGRIGYAFDRVLPFVTAGLAFASVDVEASIVPGAGAPVGAPVLAGSEDGFQLGWTVGAGVEVALGQHWSIKGEYLYYDLGSETLDIETISGAPDETATFDYDNSGSVVRAALNYRF